MSNSSDLSTYRWPFQIFLKLNENTNPNQLIDKINSGSDRLNPYVEQVSFIKLKDIYLHEMTVKSQTRQGNYKLLLLMASIALIILILAVINYVNLTVSQQIKRSKETGIRKTIGAKRVNIFYHFIFESVLVICIAFFAGTLLLMLLLPLYNIIFNVLLDPAILFRLPTILILSGAMLFVGLISGCGPAITLAATSPLRAISGSSTNTGTRNSARIILTVFQFSVSIILISSVIIIHKQVSFVKHNNPGFNAEYLLRLDMPGNQDTGPQIIYDLLAQSPLVKQISGTNGVPGYVNLWMSPNMEDSKNIGVPCLLVDTAFLKVFNLSIIRGRDFEPGDYGKVCMINEAAWKHFGFDDLENKRFNNYNYDGFEIIGVVNDFHFSSMHSKIDPLFILITPEFGLSQLNIRFDGTNTGQLMTYIRQIWQEVLPGHPLNYAFYDEWFASMYRAEERLAQSIGLFAFLAVVISCIGILGMVIFSSERRTKEIGIRKVNGARVADLILLLNGDFVKWVAIAFLISAPVAWYAMNRWLQSFAYRTELSWWIFALAGLIALWIALLTVSWQSWRAAKRNPVEALRYE
jgi:putative ABC transport system permease protein